MNNHMRLHYPKYVVVLLVIGASMVLFPEAWQYLGQQLSMVTL